MNTENKPHWLPIAPWVFLVVWSAGYGVAKLALESTTPMNLVALRFVGALLALVPFMLLLRPVWPSSNAVKDLLVVASFLQLGHFFCIYLGLSLGASAGLLALLAASQPVLVTIVASLLNRRIPSARIWAGLLVGLVGAVWVIFIQGDFSDGVLLGAILGFFAVVSLSLGQVYDKRQCPDCHPLLVYIIQYAFASIVCVPVALLFEGYQTEWNLSMISALSYLVLGNSLLGIFLMLTMVRFNAISQVTSIMFLVPGIAALIAWFVVDEVMPITAWPGIILAAVGVLLVLYAPSDDKNNSIGTA